MTPSKFDFVDLRLFLAVAECVSLSRGAERSGLSVPAASIRMKNLEQAVGSRLFHRGNRGLSLTAAGDVFHRHAARLIAQLGQMESEMAEFMAGARRSLRIGANVMCLAELVPLAMRKFLARHPSVAVDIRYLRSPDAVTALVDERIDVALIAGPVRHPDVEAISLGREPSVLVAARDHPLAGLDKVRFAQILDYELVGIGIGERQHPAYRRIARELNKELNYRIQLDNFADVCLIVSEGIGVAVIPRAIAVKQAAKLDLAVIPLDERWAQHELCLCLRAGDDRPEHVVDLIALIRQSAADVVAVPSAPATRKEPAAAA